MPSNNAQSSNQQSSNQQSSDYQPSMSLNMAYRRANMLAKIRQFFAQRDVLEVQTPILSQAGNTDVFVASVTATIQVQGIPKIYYLHTSPESAMKRLLADWQVAIYQICPVFRDNEVGAKHNSEFTMLEWYRPGFTLNDLVDELRDLLTLLYGHPQIINHYSYVQAFLDYVGIHPLTASCDVLEAIANDRGITGLDLGDNHQGWLDVLFSHLVEPNLGHDLPTIITDYPPATAAMAKVKKDKQGNDVAKRFELYIDGLEIANAYDELADKQALKVRFATDNAQRAYFNLPIIPIDEHLLDACDDMPESSGIALGIDRLLMVLAKSTDIEDVIGFNIGRA